MMADAPRGRYRFSCQRTHSTQVAETFSSRRPGGSDGSKLPSSPHRAAQSAQPGEELHDAVFSLLRAPPNEHGFNRTTGKLSELRNTLRARRTVSTQRNINAVIKSAGYRWKQKPGARNQSSASRSEPSLDTAGSAFNSLV